MGRHVSLHDQLYLGRRQVTLVRADLERHLLRGDVDAALHAEERLREAEIELGYLLNMIGADEDHQVQTCR